MNRIIAAAIISAFSLSACLSRHDTAATDVNPARWRDAAVLVYRCSDTMTLKEAALVLRHGPEASPRSGVYVVEALSPSGSMERDTLDIVLALDPSGNSLNETRVPFRTGVRLTESGEYVFNITPLQESRGVWSVALDFN